jgi:molecular chaperone DnaK
MTFREQRLPPIGIDLGTTYSVVASVDASWKPYTLANAEGEKLTPSVVLFEEAGIAVGRLAIAAMTTKMSQVAECPKRELGKRVFPKILGGRQFPPEALEAWVLNKLRVDAQDQLGPIPKAVITVPAYFDEVRRKATMDAGYMAGLEVMDIINEPTAAALAFGYQEGFLGAAHENGVQKVLVYDLGGGTFDVTVMEIEGHDFVTLATDGDMRLGGRDWDQRLMDYVAEEFIRNYGTDPRDDMNTLGGLWRQCEKAKRTLSQRPKVVFDCYYEGHVLRVSMSRELFAELTQDLLDRTEFTTRQTLEAAGMDWEELNHVLLVGGATRMPAVMDMLRRVTGREPNTSVSPDEAVAHGAALHAEMLLAQHSGAPPAFTIRNVNSHSLGVLGYDSQARQQRNAILIPRNTPLPITARRLFRTQRAGQRSILVQIVEGESLSPEDCVAVGRCTVRSIPPDLPAQTPVEVCFHYEENGRLTVAVGIPGTDTLLRHELTRDNSLTQQQLDSWRQYISQVAPPAAE